MSIDFCERLKMTSPPFSTFCATACRSVHLICMLPFLLPDFLTFLFEKYWSNLFTFLDSVLLDVSDEDALCFYYEIIRLLMFDCMIRNK